MDRVSKDLTDKRIFPPAKPDRDPNYLRESPDVADATDILKDTIIEKVTVQLGKGKEEVFYKCTLKIEGEVYTFNAVNLSLEETAKAVRVMRLAASIIPKSQLSHFFSTTLHFRWELEGEMSKTHIGLLRWDVTTRQWTALTIPDNKGVYSFTPFSDPKFNYLGFNLKELVPVNVKGKGLIYRLKHFAAKTIHRMAQGMVSGKDVGLPSVLDYESDAKRIAEVFKTLHKEDKEGLILRKAVTALKAS